MKRPDIKPIFWAIAFAVLGIASQGIGTYMKGEQKFLGKYVTRNLSNELELAQKELELFIEDFSTGSLLFDNAASLTYPIYVYENAELIFWSDFSVVPTFEQLKPIDSLGFLMLASGKYAVLNENIPYDEGRKSFNIYTLVDLEKKYPLDNKYLRPSFNKKIFPSNLYKLSDKRVGLEISLGDQYLFSIQSSTQYWVPAWVKWLTIGFYFLSFLTILYVIIIFGNNLVMKGRFMLAIAFVTSLITMTRLGMIWFQFPAETVDISIFNPINYTSSWLNPSLGDLVLNQLCLLLIVLFVLHSLRYSFRAKRWFINQSIAVWALLIAAFTLLSLSAGRYIYGMIRDVLINSQIELDISSTITFDSLRITVLVSFILISVLFFGLQFFNLKLLIKLYEKSPAALIVSIIISYLGFYLLFPRNVALFLSTLSIFWLASSQLKFVFNLGKRRYSAFLYFFLVASVVSIFGSYSIYEQKLRDVKTEKRLFANNLLIERDILGEYLLSQVLPQIQADNYIISRMYSERLADQTIEDKINRNYLIDYFDKYQAKVHIFSKDGEPFSFNELKVPLDSVQSLLDEPERKTDYDNIFYLNDPQLQDKYFAIAQMESLQRPLGTIVLELTLKNYVSSSVYPELLVEDKYSGASSSQFDYAIFLNGEIMYKVGNYNYSRNFDSDLLKDKRLYKPGLIVGEQHHHGVKAQNDKVIVITSKRYKRTTILTNFSFLFLVQIVGIGVILLLSNIFFVYPKAEINFATKISFYLGSAFIIPLFIVSVAILNSLNIGYKEEINRSYEKKSSQDRRKGKSGCGRILF